MATPAVTDGAGAARTTSRSIPAPTSVECADPPTRGSRVLRWAPAAAVGAPVLVTGVRVAASGWVATGDRGFLFARALDALTTHTPTVGQYSSAGVRGAPAVHSPGPMEYWFLGLPVRFLPSWTVPIFVAALAAGCLMASVVLARRRGGVVFAWATSVGLVLAQRSLGPVVLTDPWNPWIGLAPFVLVAFVAWSVADGERHLLPIGVAAASWIAQAHLTYVVPAVALMGVAVLGGWGPDVVARLRTWLTFDPPDLTSRRRRSRPGTVAGALAVAAACWILPVLEQLRHDPGNLGLIAATGREHRPTLGSRAVAASVGRAVGIVPGFAHGPASAVRALFDGVHPGSAVQQSSAIVICGLLVCLAAMAAVRRDRTVVAGTLVAAAGLGAAAWVAASMPADRAISVGYTFRWFTLAGLVAWLVVGLGLARLLAGIGRRRTGGDVAPAWFSPIRAIRPAAVSVGLASAVAVASVALVPLRDPVAWAYRPARTLGDAAISGTRAGRPYRVEQSGPYVVSLVPVVAYRLRAADRRVVLGRLGIDAFGEAYAPSGRRCAGELVVAPVDAPHRAGSRVLAVVAADAPGRPGRARLELVTADLP
jgi:hypothetical protein